MKSLSPKFIKRFRRFLVLFLCFMAVWFFGSDWAIESNTEGKLFSKPEHCPEVKVGLLLGTSPNNRSGSANAYFTNRIEAAVELYKAGKIKYILVSGDHGTVSYDEPSAMRTELVNRGVPSDRIFLDHAGFRTLDSMERALKVFGQKEVIVISQRFHNERAIYLGEHFGMKVYGYNAKDVLKMRGIKTKIRERFARMKVFWDICFGTGALFLGEPVKIG